MSWPNVVKEDGRTWFIIDNLEKWMDFTRGEALFEPQSYPCLVNERIIDGYCKRISEFYVRYDV